MFQQGAAHEGASQLQVPTASQAQERRQSQGLDGALPLRLGLVGGRRFSPEHTHDPLERKPRAVVAGQFQSTSVLPRRAAVDAGHRRQVADRTRRVQLLALALCLADAEPALGLRSHGAPIAAPGTDPLVPVRHG